MLSQRFSEVWVVGEIEESIAEVLRKVVRNERLRGVERLKFVFYLSNLGDLSHLNLLRPALLENTSMSIVVEEKSVKNLLEDAKRVNSEVKVIKGCAVPIEFMKAVELSGGKLKIVR